MRGAAPSTTRQPASARCQRLSDGTKEIFAIAICDGFFMLFVEGENMKNKIILNISHSSLKLPKEFVKQKKFLSSSEIQNFNKQMTDLFTDELFFCKNHRHIRAKYSRIACDVEKFVDEKLEVMAKFGLGVFYQNNLKNSQFLLKKMKNMSKYAK